MEQVEQEELFAIQGRLRDASAMPQLTRIRLGLQVMTCRSISCNAYHATVVFTFSTSPDGEECPQTQA